MASNIKAEISLQDHQVAEKLFLSFTKGEQRNMSKFTTGFVEIIIAITLKHKCPSNYK